MMRDTRSSSERISAMSSTGRDSKVITIAIVVDGRWVWYCSTVSWDQLNRECLFYFIFSISFIVLAGLCHKLESSRAVELN